MNNTINKSILIFSGVAFMGTAEGYTPQPKNRPSKEFIEQNYITSKKVFGRTVELIDDNKSEVRRLILKNIRENRKEISRMQKHLDEINTYKRSDKLITNITRNFEQQSKTRIGSIVYNRAKEIGVPKRLLDPVKIAQRQGIIIIDNFEI